MIPISRVGQVGQVVRSTEDTDAAPDISIDGSRGSAVPGPRVGYIAAVKLTRRTFLSSAAALAGSLGVTRPTAAWDLRSGRRFPPSDTLHLAVVGAGGRGGDNLREMSGIPNVKVVALCDCDARQAG